MSESQVLIMCRDSLNKLNLHLLELNKIYDECSKAKEWLKHLEKQYKDTKDEKYKFWIVNQKTLIDSYSLNFQHNIKKWNEIIGKSTISLTDET